MVTVLFAAALNLSAAQEPAAAPTPARLIFEGAQTPHFKTTAEFVELMSGRGRLRIAEVLADFAMVCEFRITEEDARGEVLLNGWGKGEIRVRLPGGGREQPPDLVEGRGTPVVVRALGRVTRSALNVWHRLDVNVAGRELTVSVNGVEAGRYEITEFAGYVSFVTRKGSVQLRSIHPRSLTTSAFVPESFPRPTDPGIASPKVVRDVPPDYTAEAMGGRVEGIVEIEAVVERDGRVGPARVIRPLDPGLDRKAIEAVRQWRFKPGLRNGEPVAVLVNIELTFTIK